MTFSLTVKKRDAGAAAKVREENQIPAVVYGPDIESMPVAIDAVVFEKLYDKAGASSLIDFEIEGNGEPIKVLIQDIQIDPVKRNIIHADFRQIKMGEKFTTDIPFVFINTSPAVKEEGGTLVKSSETVRISCLPKDLPSGIEVDLAALKTFSDSIAIGDLDIPEGVEILDNPETVIVSVSAPLTEEELEALESAGPQSVEDVEVAGAEKEEGEEGESEEAEATEEKTEETE